jgi:3-keto-5-aminohexanoate cleavage enzyme
MTTQKKEKIIILVAPVGSQMSPEILPYLPITPEEIAEQALMCYQAGASVVHVHARDEKTKKVTTDIKVFNEIVKRIREKCDMLIQVTGAMGSWLDPVTHQWVRPSDEQRMTLLDIDPKPDMMPTAMATRDFGVSAIFLNTPDYLRKVIPRIIERKLGWEMEISDTRTLYKALLLAEEGVFDKDMPVLLNYVMGTPRGNQPALPRQLLHVSDEGKRLFPQSRWEVTICDNNHWPIIILAISLGCHVIRVGLEDHFYLPNGEMVKHNLPLVETAIRIAKDLGREIATVEEAKEILSLPK